MEGGLLSSITAYLDAAMNATLHTRGVYPAEVFETRKFLNLPIRVSRHPELTAYLRKAVASVGEAMKTGTVDSVILELLAPNDDYPAAGPQAFEQHVFEVRRLAASLSAAASDDELDELERGLRASLAQINQLDQRLEPVPHDTTFAILINCSDAAALTEHNDLEISANWVHDQSNAATARHRAEIHAVKRVEVPQCIQLSHYVRVLL
mmetsp:Transcript_22712/g.58453  ORF Transcript_22712/g.58453 Transcript_22712/m.58453 type:complete len:208 (+) Transcript_22712:54-677(+)